MFLFGHKQRQFCYLAALLVALPTLFGSPQDYQAPLEMAASTLEIPQCRDLSADNDQTLFRTSAEAKSGCHRRVFDAEMVIWSITARNPVACSISRTAAYVPSVQLCENARHCRSGIQLS